MRLMQLGLVLSSLLEEHQLLTSSVLNQWKQNKAGKGKNRYLQMISPFLYKFWFHFNASPCKMYCHSFFYSFFQPWSSEQQEHADKRFALWVATSTLPVRMVKNPNMAAFLKALNPKVTNDQFNIRMVLYCSFSTSVLTRVRLDEWWQGLEMISGPSWRKALSQPAA